MSLLLLFNQASPTTLTVAPAGTTPAGSPVILGAITTRHNLCPNPACGANVTGWGGGSTPTRVTGLSGLPVTTAARYTANGYVQTPTATASPGVTYTVSTYVANNSGFNSGTKTVYLAFTRSVGGDDFSQTTTTSLTNGAVTRVSHTGLAPANTTGVYLIIDTLNGTTGTGFDITACLTEASGTAAAYFDGNTANASWDGIADNSTSSLAVAGDLLVVAPAGTAPSGSPVAFTSGTVLTVQPAGTVPGGSPVGLATGTVLAAQPAGTHPSGGACTFTAGIPGATTVTVTPAGTLPGGSPVQTATGTALTATPGGAAPGGSPVTYNTSITVTVAPAGTVPSGTAVTSTIGQALTVIPAATQPSGSPAVLWPQTLLNAIPAITLPAGGQVTFTAREALLPIPAVTLTCGTGVTFTGGITVRRRPGTLRADVRRGPKYTAGVT